MATKIAKIVVTVILVAAAFVLAYLTDSYIASFFAGGLMGLAIASNMDLT